jgi:threonine dehydrogenase-like Zn-dependent dehydrogenase
VGIRVCSGGFTSLGFRLFAGVLLPRRCPGLASIFECVGLPGILDGVIGGAPLFSRVVVVGVCMEPDMIRPAMAINKEVDLRFVVGYPPFEFRDTLHMLRTARSTQAHLWREAST